MKDEKRGNFHKVRGILKPEYTALVEKMGEQLWDFKHKNKGRYNMLDEINKDYYRIKARELIALIQPTDVLDKIYQIATSLQNGFKHSAYITQELNNIIALCTPESAPEPAKSTMRDEIDVIVSSLWSRTDRGFPVELDKYTDRILAVIKERDGDGV